MSVIEGFLASKSADQDLGISYDYPPSEWDTAHPCLIESGDQLMRCLPYARYKAVPHFLAIGPVAFQIACQQLLLAKDAQN